MGLAPRHLTDYTEYISHPEQGVTMTVDNRFRNVALALRQYVPGTYDLLAAADAIVALDNPDVRPSADPIPHDLLVAAALGSPEVMRAVATGRKINAIKELRALWPYHPATGGGIGLKAAKDAIEDERIW